MAKIFPNTFDVITQQPKSTIGLSPLYQACRQNDVKTVSNLLSTISLEAINQKESNGSTALHVAAYNGYTTIVRLLLEHGASRNIKNNFNLTPLDDARTEEIKQLFDRSNIATVARDNQEKRFASSFDAIEWIVVDEFVPEKSAKIRDALKDEYSFFIKKPAEMSSYISDLIDDDVPGIEQVDRYVRIAHSTMDFSHIIRAYTLETGFYSRLNRDLAMGIDKNTGNDDFVSSLALGPTAQIVSILSCDQKLKSKYFIGKTYRGMIMTRQDMDQYKQGSIIMTKTILSTSKEQKVAEDFKKTGNTIRTGPDGQLLHFQILCIYTIRNRETALDIEEYSEYPQEHEVLILPLAVFKVIKIKKISTGYHIYLAEQPLLSVFNINHSIDKSVNCMYCLVCCIVLGSFFLGCYETCCQRLAGVIPDSMKFDDQTSKISSKDASDVMNEE